MGKVIFLAIDNTLRDFDGTIPASGYRGNSNSPEEWA